MTTPICDFVRSYTERGARRLHMPGHKGNPALGFEALDITEIDGADALFEARGIIRESEENASHLFGAPTFYSAEGSSLAIRAMLALAVQYAAARGQRPRIAAGRNAHRTFLSAAALLDFELDWLTPARGGSYLSCPLTAEDAELYFAASDAPVTALYLTDPDYLGNRADVRAIAEVCHRHGALLFVDCAHGAYLRFLPQSSHPIDLGADLACSSAHKTLPVLTGGAYLHVSPAAPALFTERAKQALALFGSTSPSYLILQSLDLANRALEREFPEKLAALVPALDAMKERLAARGFSLSGDEEAKLTLAPKSFGYTGTELAAHLAAENIVCEFADPDFTVLMFSPGDPDAVPAVEAALSALPRRAPIEAPLPVFAAPVRALRPREAVFAPAETLPAEDCRGRILADAAVGCPPAVPIVMCGERIPDGAIDAFRYYGVEALTVVKA